MDNSGTKKEKVSRTYKGHDGYAPIAAYLGMEGWCLVRLNCGYAANIPGRIYTLPEEGNWKARTFTNKKLLVRLDSAHDAIDTRVLLRNSDKVSYISSSGIQDGKTLQISAGEPLPKAPSINTVKYS